MLRSTPISATQAKTAKDTLASTAVKVAAKITDPSDRLIFQQATKIIGKVVGLQLDARVAKERHRNAPGQSSALNTKSSAGRDHVTEIGTLNKTSNDRSVDASRIARSNTIDQDRSTRKDGNIAKSTKLRPPKDRDDGRGR